MRRWITIETDQLRLRPICQRDAQPTSRLMTADVARGLVSWPAPMSLAEARARIFHAACELRRRRGVELAILDRTGLNLMGWLGFRVDRRNPSRASVGYWLGSAYQGQGIMSAAVRAGIAIAGAEFGIRIVTADVFTDNAASIRLVTRLGMRPCGRGSSYSVGRAARGDLIRFRLDLANAAWTKRRGRISQRSPLHLG
ncbi:MAG: GNAT family N-acetyltransferase [Sphingomonas sp.]